MTNSPSVIVTVTVTVLWLCCDCAVTVLWLIGACNPMVWTDSHLQALSFVGALLCFLVKLLVTLSTTLLAFYWIQEQVRCLSYSVCSECGRVV